MNSIYVAGHRGLVGSAIVRELEKSGANVITRTHAEIDLTQPDAVRRFFFEARPEIVVLAAARVGGIKANNDFPVEFLLENLKIQNNVIECAYEFGVKKLVFLGSSCIYPKFAPQPIPESAILSGPLEPTNDAYALAKIAGIKLCQAYAREYGRNFISLMPCNMYGPGDNFDLNTSHVLPALIRKMHEAKIANARDVVLWGTGTPRREFLYNEDLASAVRFLLENYDSPEIINVGAGEDVTIRELADMIGDIVGFKGGLTFDTSKPDGTPRKVLDVSKIKALGWSPAVSLREGIERAYQWFLENVAGKQD